MSNLRQTNDRLCIIGETDPFLGRLLRRFAEKSGLRTESAQTGDELLDLARRFGPDLIILDPELPGKLRGWEALQAFRASSTIRAVPVIVCSWLKESEALALMGNLSAYLQKPDLHYEGFTAALKISGISGLLV